jgi:hypothetical protein
LNATDFSDLLIDAEANGNSSQHHSPQESVSLALDPLDIDINGTSNVAGSTALSGREPMMEIFGSSKTDFELRMPVYKDKILPRELSDRRFPARTSDGSAAVLQDAIDNNDNDESATSSSKEDSNSGAASTSTSRTWTCKTCGRRSPSLKQLRLVLDILTIPLLWSDQLKHN